MKYNLNCHFIIGLGSEPPNSSGACLTAPFQGTLFAPSRCVTTNGTLTSELISIAAIFALLTFTPEFSYMSMRNPLHPDHVIIMLCSLKVDQENAKPAQFLENCLYVQIICSLKTTILVLLSSLCFFTYDSSVSFLS